MEMGGNFCQILESGGTTIKGRRVVSSVFIAPDVATQLTRFSSELAT